MMKVAVPSSQITAMTVAVPITLITSMMTMITYNLAPSDFDHYQEDTELKNGGTGIEADMVMDQRDRNTMDMSLRDLNMAGMS